MPLKYPWKGVRGGVEPAGKSFSMNDHDTTVSSHMFKPSLFVDHSPESVSRLQREDPDLGHIIFWMGNGQKPSRDIVASESPWMRNLWSSWNIL